MATRCTRVVAGVVLVLIAVVAARAATRRYLEAEDAFRKQCAAERQKLGLSSGDLRAKYPTPEVRLVSAACVKPGAAADVVVKGTIATGAKFFVENDNFEIVKESGTPAQYRVTVKAAPGIGPESATLAMIQPMTGRMAVAPDAVRMGAAYEWTMDAANGWKVTARSQAPNPCSTETAASKYDVSFFRAGETPAFQKLTGTLVFLPVNTRNYRFDLSVTQAAPAGLEGYQALMQKMSDPKLSDAERQQVMAKLMEAQKEASAAMAKMADPAYAKQQAREQERQRQEFGCRVIEMTVEGGKVTGEVYCAEKVGRRLAVTGTVAPTR